MKNKKDIKQTKIIVAGISLSLAVIILHINRLKSSKKIIDNRIDFL